MGQVMEFFDALVRYEVGLWGAVDGELARNQQIGLGQLHALRVVERYRGQLRVQELSSEIGITVGAASKLVDRLERDGLAVRSPNPANRRSSWIDVTPAGRRALQGATEVAHAATARAIGDEDIETLVAALGRLQHRLDFTGAAA